MNIQIFGRKNCFDTKKAERYFRERRLKFQSIDIVEYGISKGEYLSIKTAVGGIEPLIDVKSKEYEKIKYLAGEDDKDEKLLANPGIFKTPIVRNGRLATAGYVPDAWKSWE